MPRPSTGIVIKYHSPNQHQEVERTRNSQNQIRNNSDQILRCRVSIKLGQYITLRLQYVLRYFVETPAIPIFFWEMTKSSYPIITKSSNSIIFANDDSHKILLKSSISIILSILLA